MKTYGYNYMVVPRNKRGRFLAPRQSRASTPEAAVRVTIKNMADDTESWDELTQFIVLDLHTAVEYERTVTVEEVETVTYEER